MDLAEVYVNGVRVGSSEHAFVPFELDVTRAVVPGENVLEVRVDDPPVGSPEHLRSAHGKQGWGNHTFPSRPSLYMTYGGIWQSVTLLHHGPLVARDVFVDGDPDALAVAVDAVNVSDVHGRATVHVATLGRDAELEVELAPGERRTVRFDLGAVDAPRWSPERPVLHDVTVRVGDDAQTVRYGLRTIRVDGRRLLLNGEPLRMKAALVQGFRAEELYAEGDRAAIEGEVRAAKRMGLNTLRLHIKAFDPLYLDVCDELGMLLHCDVPVAEPVAYEGLGADTVLARRAAGAAAAQVRRDRNHPSVVLWTAMNEIGDRRPDVRGSPGYEAFVRRVVAAIADTDGTRPVIENDWVEPDPEHVYVSPILTAHWYGRLHRDYLDQLERKARAWHDVDRPLLVTEFGDWGLPEMPELPEPPFWDTREVYAAALARAVWPGSVDDFVVETQRYQGLSNRLQAELFRRHDQFGGYCVTELTDVPHELNGLLDLHRRPKQPAVDELRRANQPVLPMLDLRSLVAVRGARMRAELHVANDGPELRGVVVEVCGERLPVGTLAAHRPTALGPVAIGAADELVLRVRVRGRVVAENRYPLHVVEEPHVDAEVRVAGDAAALAAVGARAGSCGPLVVAESALGDETAGRVRDELARGETVLVLAQPWETGLLYPVPFRIRAIDTRWGGSIFQFTTADSELRAFPPRTVFLGEDATFHARGVVVEVDGRPLPEQPMVVRYNPRGNTGTLVGAHRVGGGRLVFCQYELSRRALAGDAAARALLADLVAIAVTEPALPRRSAP